MVGGAILLIAFYAWERRLGRRGHDRALIDVSIFSSASFTWGMLLSSVVIFAMIGVIFTLPQYFQGVLGINAISSGFRLLPIIGGLVIGAFPADRVAKLLGAKITVALGFAIIAIGMALGAATKVDSSAGFVIIWTALSGVGMGVVLATASSAALVELSEERSGVGSAVLQAVNKVGSPFGVAILGSVLSSGYVARLQLASIPSAAHAAVRESVFGGIAVAGQLKSASLLNSVRLAFMHGMDRTLAFSVIVAVLGMVLALIFLPRSNAPQETAYIAHKA
jgi:Na+/melibiose symporter-like transporter